MEKLLVLLLLISLWTSPVNSEAAYMNKLDPMLKMLVRSDGSLSQRYRLPSAIGSHKEGSIATLMEVSVAQASRLEAVGVNVRSVLGNIITADIPVSGLLDVAKMETVVYVEASRRMKPCRTALDTSVPSIGIDQIWNSNPNFTGKDVVVGIIDTGIDFQHEAFRNPDGSTRILAIWDQVIDTPGQAPAGFNYGTEWTKGQIDAGVCSQIDTDGHGTHVASIAAGNPTDKNGTQASRSYVGVAPEADIIFVKYTFYSDATVDAAKYIFDKAEQLGKPAVLNMSFGSQYGPHDGRGLEQEALNFLLREAPGRAIVAAAGNSGAELTHIGDTISATRTNPQWTMFRSGINSPHTLVQIWYDRSDKLDVSLLVYENDNHQIWDSDWIRAGESVFDFVQNAWVSIDSTNPHPEFSDLGLVEIYVESLTDRVTPLDTYAFELYFSGEGVAIDAYCIDWGYGGFFTSDDPMYLMPDGEKTVGSPASAEKLVAVASYRTKGRWLDLSGTSQETEGSVGEISYFSSRGPLRNGGQKPDITAPGELITAALSEWSYFSQRLIDYDDRFVALQGTSMAAPHVTGVVALMFQQNPDLTASDIMSILRGTAIDRGATGWDVLWGAGQIDPLSALNIPAKPKNLNATVQNEHVDLTWSPNNEANLSGYKLQVEQVANLLLVEQVANLPLVEQVANLLLVEQVANLPLVGQVANLPLVGQVANLPIDVGNVTEHKLLRNELPQNEFAFSVIAYNSDGNESCPSDPVVVRFDDSIQAPTGFVALEGNKILDLRWDASQEYQVTGYKIYVGDSPGVYFEELEVGKIEHYWLKDLTNDVPIYVALTARDDAGNESEKSQEIVATPHLRQVESMITDLSGWPQALSENIFSSPAVADLDGDGKSELIIGGCDEKLHAWHHDGSEVAGFPIRMNGPITGTPAVGDIDLDDELEIVVAADRNVTVLNSDGSVADGWEQMTDSLVRSAPILADIDNDLKPEIIAVTVSNKIYAWHHNGELVDGWPAFLPHGSSASPAAGDIDGDGELEILVNGSGWALYAFNGDDSSMAWTMPFDWTATYASPVIADLDSDGNLEVIISALKRANPVENEKAAVYVLKSNGGLFSGWPVSTHGTVDSAVAVGDVDKDGDLEIAAGDDEGFCYLWHHDGTLVDGWPVHIGSEITSTPILANFDDDDKSEIVIAANDYYDSALIYILDTNGKPIPSSFYGVDGAIFSTPALADIDDDGDSELIFGTLKSWDNQSRVYVLDLKSSFDAEQVEWGSYQGDLANTGLYPHNIKQGVEPGVKFITWASIKTEVGQNFPNPANPETWIPYRLSQDANVTLSIYDIKGALIRKLFLGKQPAGIYADKNRAVHWDGRNKYGEEVSSGVYFYHFQAGDYGRTERMVILK